MNNDLDLRIYKRDRGFTLIELLIVIAIVGVLSALLMANFIGVRQRARDSQRKADVRQIQSALELYRSDNSSYPSASNLNNCSSGCTGSSSCFGNSPTCNTIYLNRVPVDPLGGTWVYTYSPSGGGYTLFACLENAADSQKDTNRHASCTTASFTVANP
jgi:general secretion pathway protein G